MKRRVRSLFGLARPTTERLTLPALDVSREARAFGSTSQILVSAGLLAVADNLSEETRRELVGRFAHAIIEGTAPRYTRRLLREGVEIVALIGADGSPQQLFVVADFEGPSRGTARLIATRWEWALTDGQFDVDVREASARKVLQ